MRIGEKHLREGSARINLACKVESEKFRCIIQAAMTQVSQKDRIGCSWHPQTSQWIINRYIDVVVTLLIRVNYGLAQKISHRILVLPYVKLMLF